MPFFGGGAIPAAGGGGDLARSAKPKSAPQAKIFFDVIIGCM